MTRSSLPLAVVGALLRAPAAPGAEQSGRTSPNAIFRACRR
jgi:hypothetical protein